ncbi:MAG: hypothetical protein IPK28_18665 [Devosia sp.]|nr:hypothetical protein [Devosia sp.]
MPHGLAKSEPQNPLNFSLAEWQQAKRIGRDRTRIKAVFKDCWALSDSGSALRRALEERGYYLASGDRRGFVAVDWEGEVYSLSRWCGVPTKVVNERLEKLTSLPSVDEAKALIKSRVEAKLRSFDGELTLQFETSQLALRHKRNALVASQRQEREQLAKKLADRWRSEELERAGRLRRGLLGLWDWITGKRAQTVETNEREVLQARRRDDEERQMLIDQHLKVRRDLQREIRSLKAKSEVRSERLQSDKPFNMMDVPTIEVPVRLRRRPQSLDR